MEGSYISVDVANVAAAWIALLLSLASLILSWRANRVAERQEKRRELRTRVDLLNATMRTDKNLGRCYAFEVSVSNQSDTDNAIATTECHVTYSRDGMSLILKLRHDEKVAVALGIGRALGIPSPVRAHETVAGWVSFKIPAVVLAGATVEKIDLVMTDSHGNPTTLEPILVQEQNDVAKTP